MCYRLVDAVYLVPQDCSVMLRRVVVYVRRVSMKTIALHALLGTMAFLDASAVVVIWLELLKHVVMLLRGIVGVMTQDSAHVR